MQACRSFYVSIFVALATIFLSVVTYFCVTIAIVLLMQTVCASEKGIEIYNKMTIGIPVGTVICAFEDAGDEKMQVIINYLGGVIMIVAIVLMLSFAYKCCTAYISIIFHFVTPQEQRKHRWIVCLYSREYVAELLHDNFRASCVFISFNCIIYVCGNAFLRRDIAELLNGSVIIGVPIIYYAIMSMYKLCKKPVIADDTSIGNEALLSNEVPLV